MSEAYSTSVSKKRNRNPLSVNAHEQRYAAESQKRRYWLETCARSASTEVILSNYLKAVAARAARYGYVDKFEMNDEVEFFDNIKLGPGDAERRRSAIIFVFTVIHGAPTRRSRSTILGAR